LRLCSCSPTEFIVTEIFLIIKKLTYNEMFS
jgi:hypothetical protein